MSLIPPVPGGVTAPVAPASTQATERTNQPRNAFATLLNQTNQDQLNSDTAVQQLVTGQNDNVQQVVMQVVKAEMSFQFFMEVRNQLIESYNELMRMQF